MAPEYAMEGLFSVESDVFSFGVLLLEIISGRKNTRFYLYEQGQSLLTYVRNHLHLCFSQATSNPLTSSIVTTRLLFHYTSRDFILHESSYLLTTRLMKNLVRCNVRAKILQTVSINCHNNILITSSLLDKKFSDVETVVGRKCTRADGSSTEGIIYSRGTFETNSHWVAVCTRRSSRQTYNVFSGCYVGN